jgi:hypothetical protein
MTRTQQFFGAIIVIALAILIRPDLNVRAQSTATPLFFAPQAANSLAGCVIPTGSTVPNSVFFCFVNTHVAATSGLYYALDGTTTWNPVTSPSSAPYTGTLPIVVTGQAISCPTCAVTGAVVTSFGNPPRTGGVVLVKADVTSTGAIAAVPASSAPLQ